MKRAAAAESPEHAADAKRPKAQQAHQVCIKVPKKTDKRRKDYDLLPSDPCARRNEWFESVVGDCGLYCGRPKCDGGWYHVPAVKAGSLFANPFSLKDYSLADSAANYTDYLQQRSSETATVESLIKLFPPKLQPRLHTRFVDGNQMKAKSVAHYELDICGDAFRERLIGLRGRKLACWCDQGSTFCHATILSCTVNRLA